jgi:hypothetical protein
LCDFSVFDTVFLSPDSVAEIASTPTFVPTTRGFAYKPGTNLFFTMGKQIPLRTTFNLPDGREIALETGKLAAQADGSVIVRWATPCCFVPLSA